ncbi:MAG TPA: NnrS family protein [Sandaracinaceae bacterium]
MPYLLTQARPAARSALLAKGFRPFFLLAALWAAAAVPLWLVVQAGRADVGAYFVPAYWHAHEMVFGYAAAVVAGFLLTAASNWTGRETATGALLLALAVLWIAGRAALLASSALPEGLVAAVNLAFLPALALVLGRVIVGARNRRNYGIVAVLALLWLAQLASHAGALRGDLLLQRGGTLVGVDLVLVLVAVIGGRIVPAFTRNATKAEGIRSFPWLDRAAVASVLACGVADATLLSGAPLAAVFGVAAALNLARARAWGARHALREPLLWVLHLGWLVFPLGLALRAAAALTPAVGAAAALHVLTVGTIGVLTLGMMARVALGHTGRPLSAPPAVSAAFVLLALATIVRAAGPMVGGRLSTPALHAAGALWALAFVLYLVRLGPALVTPRPDGRPG